MIIKQHKLTVNNIIIKENALKENAHKINYFLKYSATKTEIHYIKKNSLIVAMSFSKTFQNILTNGSF